MRKRTNKWRVIIYYKYRKIHLGMFDDEIEAAKELYGQYAKLNNAT
ncbi:MAG: hypothetical protein ABR969_02935 [Sedimentisphaerales bacterium]